MRIDIISAIPKLLTSYFEQSILKRAQEKIGQSAAICLAFSPSFGK